MVYQYSDDYIQQLEISKDKKLYNIFNDRKFLVTTLNLLYKHNFWYGDEVITNLVKEVRKQVMKAAGSFIKITLEGVKSELLNLKKSSSVLYGFWVFGRK